MLPECTKDPEGLALLEKCKDEPENLSRRLELIHWLRVQGETLASECIHSSISWRLEGFTSQECPMPKHWSPLDCVYDGWPGTDFIRVDQLIESYLLLTPWLTSVKLDVAEHAAREIRRFVQLSKETRPIRLAIKFDYRCKNLTSAIGLIAQAPQFKDLEYLELIGRLGSSEIEKLANSEFLRRLKYLTIREASFSDNDVQTLAQSPILENISELNLQLFRHSDHWLSILAESPYLRKLKKLWIMDRTFLFEEKQKTDFSVIAKSPIMKNLSDLVLHNAYMNELGAKAIARSPKLGNLRNLCIGSSSIGKKGCIALAGASCFQQLTSMTLRDCDIGPDGAKSLARSENLPSLENLTIAEDPIDDGVADLLASSSLTGIKRLIIESGKIKDQSILKLAKRTLKRSVSSMCPLEYLFLCDNQITEIGAEALLRNDLFQNLKILNLSRNSINPDSHERLIQIAQNKNVRLYL